MFAIQIQGEPPNRWMLFGEAETVTADDHAVLQDHAIADAAIFAHDRMRVSEEVVPDARAAIDGHEAVQHGVAAEHGAFVHVAIGADVRAFANLRRRGDHSRGMNRRRVTRRRVEKADSSGEIEVRIL